MTIDRWPQAQAARGRAHAAPLECRAAQVSSVTCPALACPGLHLSVPCRPCCQPASVTSTGEECQFSPAADFTRCQAGSTGEGPPPVQCSVVLGPAWGDLDPRPPGHTGQGPALHCSPLCSALYHKTALHILQRLTAALQRPATWGLRAQKPRLAGLAQHSHGCQRINRPVGN